MTEWDMEQCECCGDTQLCCFACFCPCLAYKEAAENMGGEGWMYCLATFPFGLGCCSLTFLGKTAADKRGIKIGLAGSACRACCDPCCCYSCTVVNESRIIKLKEAGQLTELMKR